MFWSNFGPIAPKYIGDWTIARFRQSQILDPSSGQPPPAGVLYRGPSQYRARKLVNGRRVTKTFTTARKAARWLTEVEIDVARGQFVDLTEAQRYTLQQIIERYLDEILGDDSEKRGAEKEKGHLKIVLVDEACAIRMSRLTSADIAAFRDRMKSVDYAPATIVQRLNLVQTIIEHARREWRINIARNPAQLVKRPAGADHKRDRVFAPANSDGLPVSQDDISLSEEERLLLVRPAVGLEWGRERETGGIHAVKISSVPVADYGKFGWDELAMDFQSAKLIAL